MGSEVVAVLPDKAVYPLEVGEIYTITNVKYHSPWGWEYEIENYKKQIFDEYEFSSIFRHKYEIKEDVNKGENIRKFMRLASFISIKESDRYKYGRRIDFDVAAFEIDETVDDLKQDPQLPVLIRKMKNLIHILEFHPEYEDKELEDLWIYL